LQQGDIKIHLIEAASHILPALPKYLSDAASLELEVLGIIVRAGQRVTQISENSITFDNGETLESSIIVWAAGIKAPTFLSKLDGLEHNKINQLLVTQTLQTTLDPNIYAIGDCASCPRPGYEQNVPPRAQAAHQQANVLAKTLIGNLSGHSPLIFSYRDYGSFISFSRYSAVGNLMGRLTGKNLMIEGRLARIFYISLYRMHQIALFGFTRTSLIWLNDMFTKALRPRLKLH
jgi:NADH dehydrogenase